jgi:hypothetical protein
MLGLVAGALQFSSTARAYNGAAAGIDGAGAETIWGTFNTIPPVH